MTFPDQAQCPICRAEISAGMRFCGECGSKLEESAAEKIRSVNFLLAELSRWEAAGVVGPDQASSLREKYERRRDNLRAQLILNGKQGKRQPPEAGKTSARQRPLAQPPPPNFNYQAEQSAPNPQSFFPSPVAPLSTDHPPRRTEERAPRRPLLETLADPHTIRLLLYTGAAMLVVGVVIWLRDVLYLKLQEPIVQAGLLAVGTIAVTVSGWLTILRTRLRLTGRALTLTGSLLVPVNFWFLVRSGLIRDNGRAWVVCAFCTLLYAHTAALLREKLYVYLAGVAAIATTWTLVYRFEREAFGLYALSLMAISLAFLHLSRLFPAGNDDRRETAEERAPSVAENSSPGWGRLSHELWGPPLVHVGLAGVAMSALFYMPLRFGSSPSLGDGILRLRATEYDPSIAMLLFAAAAYGAWFTGRYILTDRRALLYTLSALALFWTEFLAADGLRLSGQAHLLLLAASALVVSLAARAATEEILVFALHRSSLIVAVVLASAAYPVISVAPAYTLTQSATLFLLAATFAAASAPHLCESVASATLAHASAIFASLAYIIALNSFNLQSETLFYAACTVWPFALYAIARATRRARRETQLSGPFIRVGDAEFVLLLLFAAVIAFVLDQAPEDQLLRVGELRGAMFCALCGAIVYGALRSWRDRSVFGAALMASAVLITVAAVGDALKYLGALPSAWPVASAVIIAAFLLREAAEKLLPAESAQVASDSAGPESRKILPENFAAILSRVAVIRLVADCAVIACASLWLTNALYHLAEGGTSAAVVLFLALLYWAERAARQRQGWLVHLSSIHAGALCFAVLVALRIETEWFATIFVLALFPLFFMLGRTARLRDAAWLAQPVGTAAGVTIALVSLLSLGQTFSLLRVGEPHLLAPCAAFGATALLSFGASLWSEGKGRVRYFRAGLVALVLSFGLALLRAGFDPFGDVEVYSTPVAVLLLVIAYLSVRRNWDEYEGDTGLLLWLGSLLLALPLLMHALEYRVLLGVPAAWRDLGTLGASLALLLFGVVGRLRAPVLVGASVLSLELVVLALTSVEWLQIPLKVYLMTTGALILLIWGLLEFRREQILRLRQRLNERRESAREQFGAWK